jgi:hypothetical protein
MAQPKRNRGWLWYFVIVLGLTVAATVVLGVFNLRQQLTQEQFEAARKLWDAKKPADYDLVYIKRLNDDAKGDRFAVAVRGGEVRSAKMNGRDLDERERRYHSMDQMFNDIERLLELDRQPKAPRTYLRGRFDPDSGRLIQFVRREMGTRNRVELEVEKFGPP